MTDTVTGEVARVESTTRMLEAQAPEFAKILPAHIGTERFTRWALTVLRKPELAAAMQTPAGQLSVMSALMDCASLGLEPGRTYHLVPFKGKITGVTDYKGEIQLIGNANPSASVIAQLVRKLDDFVMLGANIPPKHEADWFSDDRGEITGGYAYVDFGGGRYSLVVRMSEAEFCKHRAKAASTGVWDEWPEAQRLKTLVHQLRKWVSWSPDRKETR
jgi:phage RecT family recombinase